VYLVSDTLQCVQNVIDPKPPAGVASEARLRTNGFPCFIHGPGASGRATIRLKSGAAGFGEPTLFPCNAFPAVG
jgi:hypothetical protein